jgi:hypothetical protein
VGARQDLVDLALVAFTHVHRDPPARRDHRLAGSFRARAAADEAFPLEDDEAEGDTAHGSPRTHSPGRLRGARAAGSPRLGPGSPTFSSSGTVLGSAVPPTRTGSRLDFLLKHLTELLHIVAATQPSPQKTTELPRVLFGRLSAVICLQVSTYAPRIAFWPTNALPVLPDEPPPSVSLDVARAWLVGGLRAAHHVLSQAADGAEQPAAFSLAASDEQDTAPTTAPQLSSLEMWGHKTTTVRRSMTFILSRVGSAACSSAAWWHGSLPIATGGRSGAMHAVVHRW